MAAKPSPLEELKRAISPIAEIIEEAREGRMFILIDEEDRENEGDLVIPAQFATPEKVNFMARYGRGLICLTLTPERTEALGLDPMTPRNQTRMGTAFTVSIEAREGVSTGISAHDRALTIATAIDPTKGARDIVSPGHVFPLTAREGGTLVRAGHTEASVDISRAAGLNPSAVICEIMNDDGTMARVPDLMRFAAEHGLAVLTIAELIRYRLEHETLVRRVASPRLPSRWGELTIHAYRSDLTGEEHIALTLGDLGGKEPVLVRVHSQCLTGDIFGSLRCDCGLQLELALSRIQEAGRGVLIYLLQEGRGIGLLNKLKAYELQDAGHDTVEANERLGFRPDQRDYGVGAQILRDLGVERMRLMTNNPSKYVALSGYGLEIVERVQLEIPPSADSRDYLRTKREKLGHLLQLV